MCDVPDIARTTRSWHLPSPECRESRRRKRESHPVPASSSRLSPTPPRPHPSPTPFTHDTTLLTHNTTTAATSVSLEYCSISESTNTGEWYSVVVEQFPLSWKCFFCGFLQICNFYRVLPSLLFLFSIVSSPLFLIHTVVQFLFELWGCPLVESYCRNRYRL